MKRKNKERVAYLAILMIVSVLITIAYIFEQTSVAIVMFFGWVLIIIWGMYILNCLPFIGNIHAKIIFGAIVALISLGLIFVATDLVITNPSLGQELIVYIIPVIWALYGYLSVFILFLLRW